MLWVRVCVVGIATGSGDVTSLSLTVEVSAISVLFGILRLYSVFFFSVLLGEFFHGITIYIPMFLPEIRKNIGI